MTRSPSTGNAQRLSAPEARATLGVLISNYRTWALTRRCLDHVLAEGAGTDRILVVDDASPTPLPGDLDPRVEVLVNERNLGLPATLNRGLSSIGTDLVVVFDSDAYPICPFAAGVREIFRKNSRLAVLGFETVDADGRATGSWEREPGVASLVLGQRLHSVFLRLLRPFPARRISVFSCAMALRRDAVAAIGGFDEGLDWLDLDHDLCMRIQRSGWRVGRAGELRAFHVGAGAPQSVGDRVLRWYKTRWRVLRRAGKIPAPWLVRGLVVLRLRAELALLGVAGRWWIRSPERLRETIEARRRILRYCREHYR